MVVISKPEPQINVFSVGLQPLENRHHGVNVESTNGCENPYVGPFFRTFKDKLMPA